MFPKACSNRSLVGKYFRDIASRSSAQWVRARGFCAPTLSQKRRRDGAPRILVPKFSLSGHLRLPTFKSRVAQVGGTRLERSRSRGCSPAAAAGSFDEDALALPQARVAFARHQLG